MEERNLINRKPKKYTFKKFLNDMRIPKSEFIFVSVCSIGLALPVTYLYYKCEKKLYEKNFKSSVYYRRNKKYYNKYNDN